LGSARNEREAWLAIASAVLFRAHDPLTYLAVPAMPVAPGFAVELDSSVQGRVEQPGAAAAVGSG
jgi:hypothetical protein